MHSYIGGYIVFSIYLTERLTIKMIVMNEIFYLRYTIAVIATWGYSAEVTRLNLMV